MGGRRAREERLALLDVAVHDPDVVARYLAKLVRVPGSTCLWWTAAVSGRGHGRFWVGDGQVIIAHRFAWALMHGADALGHVAVLGHRCDNPLCQSVGVGHVVASSAGENRREWAARRRLTGSPLGDPRGPRRRARELRDLARRDPEDVASDLQRVRALLGEQLPLW